ncbi:DoxX family protein [Flavobacterium sp. 3HN19-14]|uniref:DoxX family protein n=1 Tax=Flavobacterium sp. 3HN19-14 TaxID=3448133 RepID=UPI003EE2817F
MKSTKIIFWTTTIIIFLFEGVMPAFTFNSPEAKEGIRHLGYPEYFGGLLMVFKVIGVLLLIIPKVPARAKEWAYAGFTFDFLFAGLSYYCVDEQVFFAFMPLIFLAILAASYFSYHKLQAAPQV